MIDIATLVKLRCSEDVIEHCITVSNKALEIANSVKVKVDKDLIKHGALFHDIGRCKTHGVEHALVGAEMARKLGLQEEIARIIERHIGAGITAEEAKKLGLPSKDYCPKTREEKIVAYADNLTLGSLCITFEESLKEFKRILGENHSSIKRFIELHEEIQSWM
jgi:uncharacterized protein